MLRFQFFNDLWRHGAASARCGHGLPPEGEPKCVAIEADIDSFTDMVWNALNQDNKVSLFVRFIDIETGRYETRIVNKNQ